MNYRILARVALPAAALSLLAGANAVTLVSGNSQVDIDDSTATAYNWLIGSQDHLFEQSYWFRLGTSGAFSQMGALGAPGVNKPTDDLVTYSFSGGTFNVDIRYLLTGDTISSDLAEIVKIQNLGRETLHFELLEYDDFDLNGSASGDTAHMLNSSTIEQFEGGTSVKVGVTPLPSHFQIGESPSILADITNPNFTNLDDDPTPFTGDATFAYQWSFDIAPGTGVIMSKDKLLIVPEPASVAVLALGGLGLLRRRRK